MVYENSFDASKNIEVQAEIMEQIKTKPLPPDLLIPYRERSSSLKSRAHLMQLIGASGSGSRRLAFKFIRPARSVIWLSRQWNLYAPLLWKIAEDHGISLLGLECNDRKRWRILWRELLESQVFDGWILDQLQLSAGETAFLEKLTRRHSLRILSLEERPRALFPNRAHLSLSHHSYRLQWMKGGTPTPQYFNAPFLQLFGHPVT